MSNQQKCSSLELGNIASCEICCNSGQLNSIILKNSKHKIVDTGNSYQFSFRTGGITEYPDKLLSIWTTSEKLLKNSVETAANDFKLREINETAVGWEIVSETDCWRLKQIIRKEFNEGGISLKFELTYLGTSEILLRDAELSLLNISVGPEADSILELPGKNAVPCLPFTEIPDGIMEVYWGSSPAERSPVTGVHNRRDEYSLMAWVDSKKYNCFPKLSKTGNTMSVKHRIQSAVRMKHSKTITIGTQYFRIYRGSWLEALQAFQGWYGESKYITPQQRCSWTRQAAIYEAFIGKVAFSNGINYSPYPEMDKLIEDLIRIKDLGFNTIQLMPRQPFSGYTVFDWHDTKTAYGGDDKLKELIGQAHSLGMRVILDVIMHGAVDAESGKTGLKHFSIRSEFFKHWRDNLPEVNQYREKYPQWFIEKESGENAFMLTWLFDRANLDWQKYFIEVLKYYISEYNVDGFRFDAPTFAAQPNWAENLSYPAGASCLGARQLLESAQPEIRQLKPDILWQVETCGPLFSCFADLVYDYEAHWLRTSILDPSSQISGRSFEFGNRKINAVQLTDWLEQWRLSLPTGHCTKHVFEGHGDWWYGEQGLFQRDVFGVDMAKALFAFCAFSDGAVMNFAGGEIGIESFCRRILKIRSENSVFHTVSCRYFAPKSDNNMVLGIERNNGNSYYTVFINFGTNPANCQFSNACDKVHELISNKTVTFTKQGLTLSPFKTQVICSSKSIF
jgi:Alpha amylase, catalytic domain